MKATYGEITHDCDKCCAVASEFCEEMCLNPKIETREIFKDPITDDGTKKSKKGLLKVGYDWDDAIDKAGEIKTPKIICIDQQTWQQESEGLLTTVFKDGKLVKETTLDEIRKRLNNTL